MDERNRTLLDARSWSATAVRTSVVLVVIGLLLLIAASFAPGLFVLGAIVLGAGVVAGIVGGVGSWFR